MPNDLVDPTSLSWGGADRTRFNPSFRSSMPFEPSGKKQAHCQPTRNATIASTPLRLNLSSAFVNQTDIARSQRDQTSASQAGKLDE